MASVFNVFHWTALVDKFNWDYNNFYKKTMKIYLTDQKNKFKQHLDFLMAKKVMDYDKFRLTEKISVIDIDTPRKLTNSILTFCSTIKYFQTTL